MLGSYHLYLVPEHFPQKETLDPSAMTSHSPLPSPCQPLIYFMFLVDLPFLDISYQRITQYVVFCVWLLSPRIMFSRPIHVVSVLQSFLWLNNIPQYRYATFCLSIYLLMYIWVISTFWLL